MRLIAELLTNGDDVESISRGKGRLTMKTIVGLFQAKENALSSLSELINLGVTQDHIRVLACDASGQALIRAEQNRIVAKYAGLGALLGIAIAGAFGLSIGLGALPVYGFGVRFLVIALIAFFGIGIALGGLLGASFGVDSIERVTALATEGRPFGGTLEIVETNNELAAQATDILEHTGALAVEIYPELEED
jgi:hypothetical protein